jgi:hypothetical protein
MRVRKVRNQNRVGKIILTPTEVSLIFKLGLKFEDYIKQALVLIAQKRKWEWYFSKEKNDETSLPVRRPSAGA